jgi:hypothetical protein
MDPAADPASIAPLAERWIAFWSAPERSPERSALMPAFNEATKLVAASADGAWQFVFEILRLDPAPAILEALAAGPLEEMLTLHGAAVIERLEAEAATSPAFATLLAGIWQGAMPDDIWERVRRVTANL